MKSARFIAGAFALCAFNAAATPHLTIRDAGTAAPIAGATIVFVQEAQPGPYPAATSDANGVCELRPDVAEIVVIHPAYLPQKVRLNPATSEVLLEAGQSVKNATSGRSCLRIYLASWIGHYDVEQLPTISSSGELRCGGEDVVFDVSSPGLPRSIARGSLPNLRGGTVTNMTVHVREGRKGVVYVAPAGSHGADPIVARSRLLDAQGVATFDDVAIQDHVAVIAAAEGYAPAFVSTTVTAGKQIEVAPPPHLSASAHVQCDRRVEGISAHATFALREMPALQIDRDVRLDPEGNIRVPDGGSGVVRIVMSAPARRDVARAVLLSRERPAADAGGLCPGLPFNVRGSVVAENARPLSGAVIRYGKSSVASSKSGEFQLTVTAPDAGTLSVAAPGYLRWQRWLEPSDVPTALTVRLTKGARYQFRVVERQSGVAVPTFTLRCYSAGEGPRLALQRTITSPDGRYTTPPLPDDLFQIVIEAKGYEARTHEVRARMVTRGEEKLCDLGTVDLKPMSRLTGRVVDDATRAVKDALVRVRAANLQEWNSGTPGFNAFETRSHADGTFDVSAASGTYTVTAVADGLAPAERTVTLEDVLDAGDFQLHEGVLARVHAVTRSGAPVAGVEVELHRGSADDKRDVHVEIADDDGNVSFRHLSPGAYTLVARRDHRLATKTMVLEDRAEQETDLEIGSTIVRGFATDGGRPQRDVGLALIAAETLSSPAVTVIRQQTEPSGQTRTVEVLGKAAAASVARTDSTGFFTFSDVASGHYILTLQDGTGSRSRSLTIPDAETVDGSTDFGGTPIAGMVTDSRSGTGLGGAVVLLENAKNETLASNDIRRWWSLRIRQRRRRCLRNPGLA